MPDYLIQSARLVPYSKRPKQGSGYVHVYVHEPEPDSPAAHFGSLYVVSEALISGRASEDLIDIIIATFGDHYYNRSNDQPFALARFEHAVKATNKELAAHVDRGNASWIGKLSSVIAVIVGDEVHIAHTGSAEGILARGKVATRITNSEPARPATPTKTFGSIASGELEVGDRLLLSTPALIHHLPLAKLTTIVKTSSPNAAIAELNGLLKDATHDRVGAVICEITTPELAALQLRSEQPDEIEIGAPETPLQAAKMAAAPLASTTKSTGQHIKTSALSVYQAFRPIVRKTGLRLAAACRSLLSQPWGRRSVAIGAIVLVVLGVSLAIQANRQQQSQNLFNSYQDMFQDYAKAKTLNGQAGITAITDIMERLNRFEPKKSDINRQLANSSLFDGEPTTYEALKAQITTRLDILNGLQARNPTLLKDLSSATQSATFMEKLGNKIAIIGSGKTPTIRIFNTTTAGLTDSKTNLAAIGSISATSSSADATGVYILTQAPSVWYYSVPNDTLIEQKVSFGTWPSGTAIGSYASNLYILSGNTVAKYVKAATAYSPQTIYTTLSGSNVGATALAVDGSIYTLNDQQLTEFIAGAQRTTSPLPAPLSETSKLRSSNNGKIITAIIANKGRIITFEQTAGKLSFARQLTLKDYQKINDAIFDQTSGSIFVLADNKILTIGLTR